MTQQELDKIEKEYRDAVDGKKNLWLDPGEYEYLCQQLVEKRLPALLEAAQKSIDK